MESSNHHILKKGIQSIQRAKERLRQIDQELASLTNLHTSLSPNPDEEVKQSTLALAQIPKSLFECNLVAALIELSEQWLDHHIVITINHIGLPFNLDFDRGTLLIRCIQEYLHLSIQQLEATHILVELSYYASSIELYIEDNGTNLNLEDSHVDKIWHSLHSKIYFMEGFIKRGSDVDTGNILNLIVPRSGNVKS